MCERDCFSFGTIVAVNERLDEGIHRKIKVGLERRKAKECQRRLGGGKR